MNLVSFILISVLCWVLWAMTLLSLPADLNGGGFLIPDLPYRRSAFYGLIVGIVHLAVNATLIFFWEVDSIIGTLISSVLATEILIVFGIFFGIVISSLKKRSAFGGKPAARPPFLELIYVWPLALSWWISILSAIFIIPSIIVGITAELLL